MQKHDEPKDLARKFRFEPRCSFFGTNSVGISRAASLLLNLLPSPTFPLILILSLLFLIAAWAAGKVVTKLGCPALVGEIAVGVILGPSLFDVAPMPDALMLWGEVGLMLLVVNHATHATHAPRLPTLRACRPRCACPR